jgi:Protein of unknown function (DUF3465)
MAVRKPLNRKSLVTALAVLALLAWQYYNPAARQPAGVTVGQAGSGTVQAAFAARRSGVWLETQGTVQRLLADDDEGSRHQRFVLDTGGGLTVLVAHNIDLAGRVPLAAGDRVALRGRYEWNERGGVIHWTHRDPQGRDAGGWIRKHATLYR